MIQEVSVTPKHLQVVLSGSIYAEEAKVLRESLSRYIDMGHKTISMVLSEVDHIDCSGLETLVSIHQRSLEKGGRLTFKGLQGDLKDLFELTRLNTVFEIT